MKRLGEANSPARVTDLWPGLAALREHSPGRPEVCVAVLDGPVDLSHACLAGADLQVKEVTISGQADAGMATAHGTHIASIIFGQPGSPLEGITPRCRGLVIPVFSTRPDGTVAVCPQLDLARAIGVAVNEGAQIINVSAGQLSPGGEAEQHLARAVQLCADHGILIVAAAGNEGCACLHVPAALPSVVAVGAMDRNGEPLGFSNWGGPYQVQGLLAPGEHVPGAVPGGGLAHRSGTSYAAAIVSGVAAQLLSIQVENGEAPRPADIRRLLLESSIPCERAGTGECDRFLAGRLDPARALELLLAGRKATGPTAPGKDGFPVTSQHGGPDGVRPSSPETPVHHSSEKGEAHVPDQVLELQTTATIDPPPGAGAGLNPSGPASDLAAAAGISPSDCGCGGTAGHCKCGGHGRAQLVYALGTVWYDFGSEARRDSFVQAGVENPSDPAQFLAYLEAHPEQACAVTWTLNQESTPIYAIQPAGPFAAETYAKLREFLHAQLADGVERLSVPGTVSGKAALMGGQVVPVIVPELRGMYSWSTPKLVQAVVGPTAENADLAKLQEQTGDISNFLDRVYYEVRNLGLTPQERAINYAATNAFQLGAVYTHAIAAGMKLDGIAVERSPLCRPGSDCWDVKLSFFNPARRFEQAKHVYRFTIDVSDVVPVTVGKVRHWDVY